MIKLLPCPFCGKAPQVIEWDRDAGCCYGESHIKIECCFVKIHAEYLDLNKTLGWKDHPNHWKGNKTRQEAIEELSIWNKRAI